MRKRISLSHHHHRFSWWSSFSPLPHTSESVFGLVSFLVWFNFLFFFWPPVYDTIIQQFVVVEKLFFKFRFLSFNHHHNQHWLSCMDHSGRCYHTSSRLYRQYCVHNWCVFSHVFLIWMWFWKKKVFFWMHGATAFTKNKTKQKCINVGWLGGFSWWIN